MFIETDKLTIKPFFFQKLNMFA